METKRDPVYMPVPTEESLTTFDIRPILFPDGETVTFRLCKWHWEMIAFHDHWNAFFRRSHGVLYEWYKAADHDMDADFDRVLSDAIMTLLRDEYEEAHLGLPEGERVAFDLPKPGERYQG